MHGTCVLHVAQCTYNIRCPYSVGPFSLTGQKIPKREGGGGVISHAVGSWQNHVISLVGPTRSRHIFLAFATALQIFHKYPQLARLFLLFFFSSSYLPCLGGCDHKGSSPQIGPCIAHRGGTVCSMAFVVIDRRILWHSPFVELFSSSLEPVARGWTWDVPCRSY